MASVCSCMVSDFSVKNRKYISVENIAYVLFDMFHLLYSMYNSTASIIYMYELHIVFMQ